MLNVFLLMFFLMIGIFITYYYRIIWTTAHFYNDIEKPIITENHGFITVISTSYQMLQIFFHFMFKSLIS